MAAAATSAAGFAVLGLSRLDVLAEIGVVLAGSILLALLAARLLAPPVGKRVPGREAAAPPPSPTLPRLRRDR